jgi:hypothetical protein
MTSLISILIFIASSSMTVLSGVIEQEGLPLICYGFKTVNQGLSYTAKQMTPPETVTFKHNIEIHLKDGTSKFFSGISNPLEILDWFPPSEYPKVLAFRYRQPITYKFPKCKDQKITFVKSGVVTCTFDSLIQGVIYPKVGINSMKLYDNGKYQVVFQFGCRTFAKGDEDVEGIYKFTGYTQEDIDEIKKEADQITWVFRPINQLINDVATPQQLNDLSGHIVTVNGASAQAASYNKPQYVEGLHYSSNTIREYVGDSTVKVINLGDELR